MAWSSLPVDHHRKWESDQFVTLDLRRLRPILQELTPEGRNSVVSKLREAYPLLLIDLTSRGELRIESIT